MDTSTKKIIGFDLDGVIIDHSKNKIILARELGYKISKNQIPANILAQIMPTSVYKRLKYDLYDNPISALRAGLMPGVKKFILLLKKEKTPFLIISRRKGNFGIPIKILKKYGLWGAALFNDQNVNFVSCGEDKNTKAIELGVTHFIDDEPGVLDHMTGVKNRYLFDPYNSFPQTSYIKVSSWNELHSQLKTAKKRSSEHLSYG